MSFVNGGMSFFKLLLFPAKKKVLIGWWIRGSAISYWISRWLRSPLHRALSTANLRRGLAFPDDTVPKKRIKSSFIPFAFQLCGCHCVTVIGGSLDHTGENFSLFFFPWAPFHAILFERTARDSGRGMEHSKSGAGVKCPTISSFV